MLYDIAHFWLALLAVIALGAACAWITRHDPPLRRHIARPRAIGATLLFLAGLVMAFAAVIPGRAGLWLETALLLIVAYGLGWLMVAPWMQETPVLNPFGNERELVEAERRHGRASQSWWLIVWLAAVASAFAVFRILRGRGRPRVRTDRS